ncbi:hypothetical protein AHAS_Ahas02G0209300 [Arachis hypogaea]
MRSQPLHLLLPYIVSFLCSLQPTLPLYLLLPPCCTAPALDVAVALSSPMRHVVLVLSASDAAVARLLLTSITPRPFSLQSSPPHVLNKEVGPLFPCV